MTKLKSWWEVITPHKDIREGKFEESRFALDLGAIMSGDAPSVYQDPQTFYQKTHITQVIERILTQTIENLNGEPSGNRVLRLQTGFGGGKTHILSCVYHLIDSWDKLEDSEKIQDIVENSSVESIPETNVAGIVGTDLDPSEGRNVDGLQIKTPWGELAYQLGGKEAYKIVKANDRDRTTPGKNKIVQILKETRPCTILIDELLQYVGKARAIEVGKSTLGEQTISFLDELVRAVETVDKVFALVSLQASERREMYGGEESEQVLGQIESKVKRVDEETRPIQKEEIYQIARQHLFEDLGDTKEYSKVAEAFFDYYKDNQSDFSDKTQSPDYRDRVEEAYPFHPELIDTLYQQWGSLPDFHRTRGVLRFLAKLISDQYQEQWNAPLVQPAQLNMADEDVRDEALRCLEEGWEAVIDSDIAGSDSKAAQIDIEMGGVYHNKRITRSLAASLFLFSQTGGQQPGAALERLRLGVLRPGMSPTLVADALSRCKNRFFFLHEEDGFHRFTKTPNLNRVIAQYESGVDDKDKIKEIRASFSEALGKSPFKTHIWPSEPGDIPDDDVLRLVLLHPEYPLDSGTTDTLEKVEEIWKNYKSEFRSNRNGLVFLGPDKATLSEMKAAATTKIALHEIRRNQSLMDDLTDSQVEELKERVRDAKKKLPVQIRKAYTKALVPSEDGLKRISLGQPTFTSDKGIDEVLEDKLKEKDLLLSRLDPNLLAADRWNIWPKQDGEKQAHISTQELWNHFQQLPRLPMLEYKKVLKSCIAKGVDQEGIFGYAALTEEGYKNLKYQIILNSSTVRISKDKVVVSETQCEKLKQKKKEKSEGEEKESKIKNQKEKKSGAKQSDQEETNEGKKELKQHETTFRSGKQRSVKNVEVQVEPQWENQWDETYEAVLDPLARLGADIRVEIQIKGISEEGIDKSELERQVEENLTQRDIKYKITYKDSK